MREYLMSVQISEPRQQVFPAPYDPLSKSPYIAEPIFLEAPDVPKNEYVEDPIAFMERVSQEKLDPQYLGPETPLTFYQIFDERGSYGVVLGLNVKITNGVMQLFVAYKEAGFGNYRIQDIYLQRMDSPSASLYRAKSYQRQFFGASFAEFPDDSKLLPPVKNPSGLILMDHHQFVKAVRLNMLFIRHVYPFVKSY